jgi:hypothetical protein
MFYFPNILISPNLPLKKGGDSHLKLLDGSPPLKKGDLGGLKIIFKDD